MKTFTFIATILLIASSQCTLEVLSSADLVKSLGEKSKNIPYLLAQFGSTDYGMTIIGYGHYSQKNPEGCSTDTISPYNDDDQNGFLVVKRGGCEFVEKSKFAQAAGAKILIIVDDKDEEMNFTPVAPLNRGSKIHIPTLVISKNIGEKIINDIKQSSATVPRVVLSYNNLLKRTANPELTVVTRADDLKTYTFLGEFSEMIENLRFKLTFMPFISSCPTCSADVLKDNCLDNNDKACLFSGDDRIKGSDIVKAGMIQYCFVNSLTDFKIFFGFSKIYAENCLEELEGTLDKCTLNTIGIFKEYYSAPDFKSCYNKAFVTKTLNNDSALLTAIKFIEERKIQVTPVLAISDKVLDVKSLQLTARERYLPVMFSKESAWLH